MEVLTFEVDHNRHALKTLDELRKKIEEGKITEFAVAGLNMRGEVSTMYSSTCCPVLLLGGIEVLKNRIVENEIELG